jgi:hypothetical protein
MFCPKCKTEYVEGVTICEDCSAPLVSELPPGEEDSQSYRELVQIFTTDRPIEANFIKSLLESNDIECTIQNQYFTSINILINIAVPITVMVDRENVERAREIIAQYYSDMKDK